MGKLILPGGRNLLATSGRPLLNGSLTAPAAPVGYTRSHPSDITGLSGWWDAGQLNSSTGTANMLSPASASVTAWSSSVGYLVDKSGSARTMTLPASTFNSVRLPTGPRAIPHLNNSLGGIGAWVSPSGTLNPTCDYTLAFNVGGSVNLSSGQAWTVYSVISRPNLMQVSSLTQAPLLAIGTTVLASVGNTATNSTGDALTVFGTTISDATLTAAGVRLTRRWTQSITLQNVVGSGVTVWVGDVPVASGITHPYSSLSGALHFLGNGTSTGAAEMYFHEAAVWLGKTFSGAENVTLLTGATSVSKRWTRGYRIGVGIVLEGQSNATNWYGSAGTGVAGDYMSSGSANLREGLRYYLGVLSVNVYNLSTGSHGSFDGTGNWFFNNASGGAVSTWPLGTDGTNYQAALAAMTPDQRSEIAAGIVYWGEGDSGLHPYSQKSTVSQVYARLMTEMRTPAGKTAAQMPIFMCPEISYGLVNADGIQMMHEIAADLIATPGLNVQLGWSNSADAASISSTYNAATGIDTGGPQGPLPNQAAHIDQQSNVQFSRRAAAPFARAILAAGYTDLYSSLPAGLPAYGPMLDPAHPPTLAPDNKTITVTVLHDLGTDFLTAGGLFPLQGQYGTGWGVVDGGTVGTADGPIRIPYAPPVVSVTRLSPTTLQIVLSTAITSGAGSRHLFYPWPAYRIGFGDAVYDNAASITPPVGWDICADLNWARFGFPIQTPLYGVAF